MILVAETKKSRFAVFGRIFRPWKWKKRKKTSDKIEKTAVGEYGYGLVSFARLVSLILPLKPGLHVRFFAPFFSPF